MSLPESDCLGAWGHYHHNNKHYRIYEHSVIAKSAENLRQSRKHTRCDYRAAYIAYAAENHKYEYHYWHIVAEILWCCGKHAEVMRIQNTGYACKKCGKRKGDKLIFSHAYTHRFGGYTIVTQRHYRSAGARMNKVQNYKQRDKKKNYTYYKCWIVGCSGYTERPVYKNSTVSLKI